MPNAGARFVRTIAVAIGAIAIVAGPLRTQVTAATLSLTISPQVLEFHAGAGDTGTATVTVTNSGTDPERVIAQRMDWHVTSDGTVRVECAGVAVEHHVVLAL